MHTTTLKNPTTLWLAAVLVGAMVFAAPLFASAQTDEESGATDETETMVDDTEEEEEASDDDSDETDEAEETAESDETDESVDDTEQGRRAELMERVTALRALLEERRAMVEKMKTERSGIFTEFKTSVEEATTPEAKRAALMERVVALRALLAERQAAVADFREAKSAILPNAIPNVALENSSIEEKRAALMERLKEMREKLLEKRNMNAESDDDSESEEESDEEESDNDDSNDESESDSGYDDYTVQELLDSEPHVYEGYLNGTRFIQTLGIPRDEALDNCELNASNNPDDDVYCTWNGEIIFESE